MRSNRWCACSKWLKIRVKKVRARAIVCQRISEMKCGIAPIFSSVRLNAYLARAGIASRRKADDLIKAGRVLVNGEPGQLNTFVQRTDDVRLDGMIHAKALRTKYPRALINAIIDDTTTDSDNATGCTATPMNGRPANAAKTNP